MNNSKQIRAVKGVAFLSTKLVRGLGYAYQEYA
jgi:hypothetical protein